MQKDLQRKWRVHGDQVMSLFVRIFAAYRAEFSDRDEKREFGRNRRDVTDFLWARKYRVTQGWREISAR